MHTSLHGSVLGVTDFGPVDGSPLIPPSYLTLYFVLFLIALSVAYIRKLLLMILCPDKFIGPAQALTESGIYLIIVEL